MARNSDDLDFDDRDDLIDADDPEDLASPESPIVLPQDQAARSRSVTTEHETTLGEAFELGATDSDAAQAWLKTGDSRDLLTFSDDPDRLAQRESSADEVLRQAGIEPTDSETP